MYDSDENESDIAEIVPFIDSTSSCSESEYAIGFGRSGKRKLSPVLANDSGDIESDSCDTEEEKRKQIAATAPKTNM